MAAENNFGKLLSKVHQGIPLESPVENEKTREDNTAKPVDDVADAETKNPEPSAKQPEKRKRKPQADYQNLFFNRIDFTHRKPLYITATTHRRLMRIVHLMDGSKATISSYVENIILNHLDTFREEIDLIYRTNDLNPTE